MPVHLLPSPTASPIRFLVALSLAHSLLVLALVHALAPLVPPFDASHPLPTVRWDAVHFLALARDGYTHEQQLAFQPGVPALFRAPWAVWHYAQSLTGLATPAGVTDAQLVLSATIINVLARAGATAQLYRLTTRVASPAFALTAAALHVLAPAPAAAVAPYTEPVYACAALAGYVAAADGRVWAAAAPLALATAARATGVLNAPVLAYLAVFARPRPPGWRTLVRRAAAAALPCALVVAPFLLFQAYAYAAFCVAPNVARPWCARSLPLAYSFVQAEYWNVGWFRYWTAQQLPNFLLAAPVLLVSAAGIARFLAAARAAPGAETAWPVARAPAPAPAPALVAHHAAMLVLLVCASHTQIALRVALADPVVWWAAAGLAFDWSGGGKAGRVGAGRGRDGRAGRARMTRAGKAWVGWCVVWGAASIVLWAGHYPPA